MSGLPKLTTGTTKLNRRNRGVKVGGVSPSPINLGTPIQAAPIEIDIFKEAEIAVMTDTTDIKVTKQEKDIIAARARERIKDLPTLSIDSISYSLFSHEDLEKIAVFKVTKEGKEGLRTVNDPRGGVVDNDKVCTTCQSDNLTCPGHLGMISLHVPIIHPMFRREVIYILMSVCNSCGGLLCPKETLEEKGILNLNGTKRLQAIAAASEKCHCRRKYVQTGEDQGPVTGCIPNPYYKISTVKDLRKIFYSYEGKKGGKDNIRTVEEIEKIFSAISPEDAEVLGFENDSHPSRFIMKSLPVIPICARAPVVQDGLVLNDDLTTMYMDIVSHNLKLDPALNTAENVRTEELEQLIFSIEHMIDNADNRYRQGKKKPFLDIKSRIQGKEAIIRSSIQGKRVNYSARTVLGPAPELKFGQIRIPKVMAPYLTQPETVSPANIGRLTQLLRTGKITHIVPLRNGRRLKVDDKMSKNWNLSVGDKIDRWLQNGDYVVFNRQPTLHKQGIMGYEVVLGDPLTIGLHLAYTTPHNADFDGDEGAIHAPQGKDALVEVALLMCVRNNIMNSQNNRNIMGVVYDALTGAYLLTQPDTYVDSSTFSNIVIFLENTSGRDTLADRLNKASVPITSGRALFSSALPEDFYYRKGDVLIKNGILISGVINKDHIGASHGSIIQVMMKDYGQETTVDFFTDIYNMMREWLNVRGFSVGLDDCFLSEREPYAFYVDDRTTQLKAENKGRNVEKLAKKLERSTWKDDWSRLTEQEQEIYIVKSKAAAPEKTIQQEVQRAKMLVRSMGWTLEDPLEEERREKQIIAYLNTARGLGARISEKHLKAENAYRVMAEGGAKGNTFNIAQITGILGQQFVQGQRMPMSMRGRCSPYFPENSLDPAARGFCVNSFLTGLDPSEMFFHQAGGREGLTDTAIKTSETGHMHHKIVKALEDVKVYEDGSARNAFGVVFQYVYGEDGFDAAMLETVSTKTGSFTSFINTTRLAARLNTRYGYDTPGEPLPDIIEMN